MKSHLIEDLSNLLDKNLIPYMEISETKFLKNDATIKVYFPKIMLNICKLFDRKYVLKDKKNIFISKDKDGYSFVDLLLLIDEKVVKIRICAILKNTWGIAEF